MLRRSIFRAVFQNLDAMLTGRGRIDEELFEQIEEALLAADLSVKTADRVLDELRQFVRDNRLEAGGGATAKVQEQLKSSLVSALGAPGDSDLNFSPDKPSLFLMVGVNGVGKTTSLGKLAYQEAQAGKKVMLAAGDTFRAAAAEQLAIWAQRAGADFIRQHERSDPAAVVFDAVQAAKSRGTDLILVDTAGRLHNKQNLMEELRKIGRVCERELGRRPDETLLALDATTGQNAIRQAKEFMDAVKISGIVLNKLDGTARAGVVITIREELGVPIKLVGVGEAIDDLLPFNPEFFVEAMLSTD